MEYRNNDPNKPLQLTAGIYAFINVFGVVAGFGLSNGFRQTHAATELGSLAAAYCKGGPNGQH